MLYMLLLVSAGRGGPAGMRAASMPMTAPPGGVAGLPTVALGLALALFAGVLLTLDRLTSLGPAGEEPAAARVTGYAAAARVRAPMSPRLAAGCEIVMGLTMGYMLITML